MNGHKFLCEQEVGRLANQVEKQISIEQVNELLASGNYERATGLKDGIHFRRQRGQGCFHLRIDRGRAWLHWDKWDPRRFPVRHFFETPALWVPTGLAALGAAALAGMSRGSGNATYDPSTGRHRDKYGRFTRAPR